jgi:hypothetical protein
MEKLNELACAPSDLFYSFIEPLRRPQRTIIAGADENPMQAPSYSAIY